MKIVSTAVFLLLFLTPDWSAMSNEETVQEMWTVGNENIDTNQWKAHWIWMNEGTLSDVMLARRSFEIDQKPDAAELKITASSQYQLYINGKYYRRGPARSAPHHQSFDILDIKDLLSLGRNTLAVRVHHQRGKYAYHYKGRPGLLAQLDITQPGASISICSDTTWKVSPDPSWDNTAPRISRFQLVVNDRVDLRKEVKDWHSLEFDDGNWSNATSLVREVGWPAPQPNAHPQPLIPPWTALIPRDLPHLKENEVIPIRKIPSKDHFVLFDFGQVYNAFPQLQINGPEGTIVDVVYAPYLLKDTFSYQIVASEFRDRILLSGQKDNWEATYFKPIRYVGLIIKSNQKDVNLYKASLRTIAYPFDEQGYITSSDAVWIDAFMQASAKTIKLCTTDGYTDNYRERRQYAQTGYYAALGNYWIFGDHKLQRRYLIQIAQEQEANGIMPAYAPLSQEDYMIILDSNCLWIRSLRNYYLYSGDAITVQNLLPAARKLLDLLHSFTNKLGFLYNPPYPYWLDHAVNDRRGANFCLNGHYLGALEDFGQVLKWLEENDSQVYLHRAATLRQSLQLHWEQKKGLFSDAWIEGKRSPLFSEHANAIALALNIATEYQAKKICQQLIVKDNHNFIKRSSGITMVTPAMSYFLHQGLCNYGYIKESFDLFQRRFSGMLDPKHNGTLWEEWWLDGTGRSGTLNNNVTRSDAQTESAFPPALFGEHLLGVQPIKPGFSEVMLRKSQMEINHIEGKIPTPQGMLFIYWNMSQRLLRVKIPENMVLKIDVKSMGSVEEKIKINGEYWNSKLPYIKIVAGNHQVYF